MQISKGKIVKMDYELAVEGGEVIETSANHGPLTYVHGAGVMLAGLEKHIDGMTVGQEKQGVIPASEAYGTEEMLPTQVVSKNEFPQDETITVGKTYSARNEQGQELMFSVVKLEGDEVTIRYQHPLTGKSIRYKVKILDITDPKAIPPAPPGTIEEVTEDE